MSIDEKHQPDLEFVSRLEWQLMTEHRKRQKGLFQRSSAVNRWGWGRVAALVLISALAGMAGLRAAQGWERSLQYKLALAQAEAQQRLAELRLEASLAFEKEHRRAVEAGVASGDEADWAAFEVAQAENDLARVRSSVEEMRASGEEVNDSLYAPTVNGRDCVGERIQLEITLVRRKLELAAAMASRVETRVKIGLDSPESAMGARAEMVQVEQELKRVERRLDLRRRYLEGEVDADEILAMERLGEVRGRIEAARARLEAADTWLNGLERKVAAGLASQGELLMAKYEHERMEADLRLAQLEEQLLREHSGQ